MEEFKPGQVISPQASSPVPEEPSVAPAGAPEPERPSTEPPTPPSPTPPAEPQAPIAAEQPQETWQFRNESTNETASAPTGFEPAAVQTPAITDELSWTASEFIAHEKSVGWYGLLGVSGIIVAVLIYIVTKDKVSTGIVLFAAAALGTFAARKPQIQQYKLGPQGLQVGPKLYNFQDFKTFSVAEEGAIASVIFMPLKRFMPPLTIYIAPDIEERIINFLTAYLPFEQNKTDAVDNLLRRIRF